MPVGDPDPLPADRVTATATRSALAARHRALFDPRLESEIVDTILTGGRHEPRARTRPPPATARHQREPRRSVSRAPPELIANDAFVLSMLRSALRDIVGQAFVARR
jgi:hypothetical protein